MCCHPGSVLGAGTRGRHWFCEHFNTEKCIETACFNFFTSLSQFPLPLHVLPPSQHDAKCVALSATECSSHSCCCAALDGKGRALLPADQVRELVWNISNHPNPCNRSESIETLYKAITFTRKVDDQHVTEAFGASLRPFLEFVITSTFPNDSSGTKTLASSESHFGVLRHLMVRHDMHAARRRKCSMFSS